MERGQPHPLEGGEHQHETREGQATGPEPIYEQLSDEQRIQRRIADAINGLSLTDAIRKAVELYVETKRSEDGFAERAAAALEEIEREAATRRAVIQGLFGQGTVQATTSEGGGSAPTDKPTGTRSRKPSAGG